VNVKQDLPEIISGKEHTEIKHTINLPIPPRAKERLEKTTINLPISKQAKERLEKTTINLPIPPRAKERLEKKYQLGMGKQSPFGGEGADGLEKDM